MSLKGVDFSHSSDIVIPMSYQFIVFTWPSSLLAEDVSMIRGLICAGSACRMGTFLLHSGDLKEMGRKLTFPV